MTLTLVVPADYFLALVDTAAYRSFVSAHWTPESLQAHFAGETARGTLLVWGTEAPGNWRVAVRAGGLDGWGEAQGFREFTARITATGDRLHLTSYDALTVAAQFPAVRLPRPGTEDWAIPVTPGVYDVRLVQLYDPAEAETETVFYQKTPHFALELRPVGGSRDV